MGDIIFFTIVIYLMGIALSTILYTDRVTSTKELTGRLILWPLFFIKFAVPFFFVAPLFLCQSIAAGTKALIK